MAKYKAENVTPFVGGSLRVEGGERGDQRVFLEAAYRQYWKYICRYVARRFGSGPPEPEDVAQIVFARFATVKAPQKIDNPRAYLVRTAVNVVIDHKRKETSNERNALGHLAQVREEAWDNRTPERFLVAKDDMRIVQDTLAKLPETQREIVLLSRVESISSAEIARMKGMSATEVKRQIASALAQCDEALLRAKRAKD